MKKQLFGVERPLFSVAEMILSVEKGVACQTSLKESSRRSRLLQVNELCDHRRVPRAALPLKKGTAENTSVQLLFDAREWHYYQNLVRKEPLGARGRRTRGAQARSFLSRDASKGSAGLEIR